MLAWLTPDTTELEESQDSRVISVPGSLWHYIGGALLLLLDDENWEQFGSATAEESADFFADVYDEWAMSKLYIVGEIRAFATIEAVPDGWETMSGQVLAQSGYPALTAVVPASWKSGGNITLPDMEDSFMAHVGDTATLGQFSGANNHTLTVSEIPAHGHSYSRRPNTFFGGSGTTTIIPNIEQSANTGQAGGGQAHNNMPRNLGVIYAIYTGA